MDRSQSKPGISWGPWLVTGIGLIILGIVGALLLNRALSHAAPASDVVPVGNGSLTAIVAGSSAWATAQSGDFAFHTSASVSHVVVEAGDTVKLIDAGDPKPADVAVAPASRDHARSRQQRYS